MLMVLICSVLAWSPIALSQEIDEGEFSRAMLGYKLVLLKNQFEQAERKLSTWRQNFAAGAIILIYSMSRSSLFAKNFG